MATQYRYFASPPSDDAWAHKIARWQARELADQDAAHSADTASVEASPDAPITEVSRRSADDLRTKYTARCTTDHYQIVSQFEGGKGVWPETLRAWEAWKKANTD